MNTTDKIKVRACEIINTSHPEWGTFGVMDEYEDSYDIIGDAGAKNISKTEADKFWKVLEARNIERQSVDLHKDNKRLEWLFSNASISLCKNEDGEDWWVELDYTDPRKDIDEAMNTQSTLENL